MARWLASSNDEMTLRCLLWWGW